MSSSEAAWRGCVLVTGAPAAGKSTLGRALATRLDVPLIGKDTIKEALFDALGVGDVAWSKRCGAAAMEVLFSLLPELRGSVIECNFSRDQRERIAALVANPIEVFCRVPVDVATARFVERRRHEGHRDAERYDEIAGWVAAAEPLAIGPVLEVETVTAVDSEAVVRWIVSRSDDR